jgi:molybdopterin converting factor small subunit
MGPDGEVRQFVNIYLGNEDVRVLQGMSRPVSEGDVVSIVPAVAGGMQ